MWLIFWHLSVIFDTSEILTKLLCNTTNAGGEGKRKSQLLRSYFRQDSFYAWEPKVNMYHWFLSGAYFKAFVCNSINLNDNISVSLKYNK